MRGFLDPSQPFYITGTETVIAVPFRGDAAFFQIQPQSCSLSLGRVEVGNGELLLRYVRTDQNGEAIRQATGETFNFQGKTDILIRVEGKNVFIAECKFWKGEKAFLLTIDQLLSYLSWRDTKTAILVFNRNADFSAVIAKIAESVPTHPNFKRDLGRSGEHVPLRVRPTQRSEPGDHAHRAGV
jgi:hypothetical protein